MRGCDLADDWTGQKRDFTIGLFKNMCKPKAGNASHKLFLPNQQSVKMEESVRKARFKKLHEMLGE